MKIHTSFQYRINDLLGEQQDFNLENQTFNETILVTVALASVAIIIVIIS